VQAGSILRIASRVAVQIKEKCNLYRYASARSVGVVSAIASVAPLHIHINGIIAVADRALNFLAYFGNNCGSGAAVRRRGSIDDVTVVSYRRPYLAVRSRVFVRSFRVIGVTETCVPGIKARDFIPDEG
jgi:hypothetical protein